MDKKELGIKTYSSSNENKNRSDLNDLNELSALNHILTVFMFDVFFSSFSNSIIIVLSKLLALTEIFSSALTSEIENTTRTDNTTSVNIKTLFSI